MLKRAIKRLWFGLTVLAMTLAGGCANRLAIVPGYGLLWVGDLANDKHIQAVDFGDARGNHLHIDGYSNDQTAALQTVNKGLDLAARVVAPGLPVIVPSAGLPATQPAK